MKITIQQARRLTIAAQGLDGRWKLPAGKEGVAHAIERLGVVQIDTISVIERAHHHTLWTRRRDYQPEMLHQLLAVDRRVFEYWATPAAGYVPMSDYRWYLPRMHRVRESEKDRKRNSLYGEEVKRVLSRIKAEGPLASADFAAPPGKKRGTWWDWKPAKHALEMLFARGELMVSSRRNFHRVYDLAERVLPADVDRREPTPAEAQRFAVHRYLAAHGVVAAEEIGWASQRRIPVVLLHELQAAGEIVAVQIEGLETAHWALPAVIAACLRRRSGADAETRVRLLSPFDSFVHRKRLERLFNFHYKIECYVPASKRKYGYFSLPILFGEQIVGRLDPKAERSSKRLLVRGLVLEDNFKDHDALLAGLAQQLQEFAQFNGCDQVEIQHAAPSRFHLALLRALSR